MAYSNNIRLTCLIGQNPARSIFRTTKNPWESVSRVRRTILKKKVLILSRAILKVCLLFGYLMMQGDLSLLERFDFITGIGSKVLFLHCFVNVRVNSKKSC